MNKTVSPSGLIRRQEKTYMKKVFKDYFMILPVEIAIDILTRQPAEAILDCKLVSKTWRNLIGHLPFSKVHLQHLIHRDSGKLGFIAMTTCEKFYYFEYSDDRSTRIRRIKFDPLIIPRVLLWDFRFVGSCNGLICLAGTAHSYVCIWNPITKEYVKLPGIDTYTNILDYVYQTYGYGYVSSTNVYKVVAICVSKSKFVEVYIYTLGSGNGWRSLGKFGSQFSISRPDQGIFANGALYWMAAEFEKIVTFDLAEEKFREHLSPPPSPPAGNWFDNRINVLDGLLMCAIYVKGDKCYNIWLLRKNNDNEDMIEPEEHQAYVWKKEFRAKTSQLVSITETGGVLTYHGSDIGIYDTKASTSKDLVNLEGTSKDLVNPEGLKWIQTKLGIHVMIPHTNTLISLKEFGEARKQK